MCWCGLQTIYQFHVDKPSKSELMINNVRHVFAACLVQEETIKTGFRHEIVRKQEVFVSNKTTCSTPFPIGGKRHHTNQSQNDMANHVIWLLRNRWKLREGRRRKSDSDGDRETAIEIVSFES